MDKPPKPASSPREDVPPLLYIGASCGRIRIAVLNRSFRGRFQVSRVHLIWPCRGLEKRLARGDECRQSEQQYHNNAPTDHRHCDNEVSYCSNNLVHEAAKNRHNMDGCISRDESSGAQEPSFIIIMRADIISHQLLCPANSTNEHVLVKFHGARCVGDSSCTDENRIARQEIKLARGCPRYRF